MIPSGKFPSLDTPSELRENRYGKEGVSRQDNRQTLSKIGNN
jgi:hypothetical protein